MILNKIFKGLKTSYLLAGFFMQISQIPVCVLSFFKNGMILATSMWNWIAIAFTRLRNLGNTAQGCQ